MNRGLATQMVPDTPRSESCELSEAEAIHLAQQGNEQGFERIYKLHRQRVYGLCFRMMSGNAAEAEDLTQESFFQIFRKIATFRGESAFTTWLHQVTVNIVLMRLRKRHYQLLSLDEMLEPERQSADLQKHIGARDLRLSGSLDRMDLERALEQLPPGYRAAFILHDVEGYEHNEIASITGWSLGNSKSQLHRARIRLRQLLSNWRPSASRELGWTGQQHESVGLWGSCTGRSGWDSGKVLSITSAIA